MKVKPWTACGILLAIALGAAGCRTSDPYRTLAQPSPAIQPAPARPGEIPITPANARIDFTGATAIMSQSGYFAAFDGTIEMPSSDPVDAKIRVVVDVGSVTTSIGLLTRHLKQDDFFDVARYPRAEFVSEAIRATSEPGVYDVTGQLQFHGVTKQLEFPARIHVTSSEMTFDGTMTLSQTAFGMTEAAKKTKDEVPVKVSIRGRRM